jgi:hypothetical protein
VDKIGLPAVFMRYASRLLQYLALNNEISSSTVRAFYKNAQIFTAILLALKLFLELICFMIIAEQFALLRYINQNAKTVLIFKYGTVCAFDSFSGKTENFREKYGTLRA